MKVYMRPVEMIACFSTDKPRSIKFKLRDRAITMEQVISFSKEKLAGSRMIVYKCQSEMNGELKPFELKFELQSVSGFVEDLGRKC